MLLASNALASAPLVAESRQPFSGAGLASELILTAAATQVGAALQSGLSAGRQQSVERYGSRTVAIKNIRSNQQSRIIQV